MIVATAAIVVAAGVSAAGFGVGALWVFEVLAGAGLLVGLVVAFGTFDRRAGAVRRSPRRDTRRPAASRSLTEAVDAQLRSVDPVEHRRLDLGDPWPVVIVGPTGVTVLAVTDRMGVRAVARAREVAEVAAVAREVAAALPGRRRIAVAAVLVLPDGQVASSSRGASPLPGVGTVAVRDLPDLLARGPIVPMATVIALFAHLSNHLAPDLRVDVV